MTENPEASDMTLRDYFAGQALTKLVDKPLARGMSTIQPGSELHPSTAARRAYLLADAMLSARQETRHGE